MTSTILVTGATGFIGRRLAEVLAASGKNVRLLVREERRLSDHLRSSCQVIVGALDNENALIEATEHVDIVYHCAANVRTWDVWPSYYETNVLGLEKLLRAIHKTNSRLPRLVYLSSVDVYGYPAQPCDETAPLDDAGFYYGRSKILAEAVIREDNVRSGLPYTILRPCNVIGPRSPFIERIGRELASGLMLTVDGGGCHAGLLYVDNLVKTMIRAAESPQTLNRCYNVRDGYDLGWKEFLGVFRDGIAGKGLVVNLPFAVASRLGSAFATVYRTLGFEKEPLLHPLIVRIFGRTCGHCADEINQVCGSVTSVPFDEAMQISCRWFLDNCRR